MGGIPGREGQGGGAQKQEPHVPIHNLQDKLRYFYDTEIYTNWLLN